MLTVMKRTFASIMVALILAVSFGMGATGAHAAGAPTDKGKNEGVGAGTPIVVTATDATYLDKAFQDAVTKEPKRFHVTFKPNSPSYLANTASGEGQIITNSAGKLVFNVPYFNDATEDTKRAALKNFVETLQNSPVSSQSQQQIMTNLGAQDNNVNRMLIPMVMDSTSADLFTAMKWVNPILPVIRVVFGVGAIVVSLLLVASTIVDLCFIGLPVARESLQNKGGDNGGGGKVPFVSMDAVSVIKETESALDSSGGYKNAYVMYFKRRVLTYIIIAICLLYLVVGELGGLISWLLNLGSGII